MAGMKSTKDDNFTRRLAQTWGSELEPEMVTPMTAGSEELPYYNECMPIIKQFKQTNMGKRPYSENTNFKKSQED